MNKIEIIKDRDTQFSLSRAIHLEISRLHYFDSVIHLFSFQENALSSRLLSPGTATVPARTFLPPAVR